MLNREFTGLSVSLLTCRVVNEKPWTSRCYPKPPTEKGKSKLAADPLVQKDAITPGRFVSPRGSSPLSLLPQNNNGGLCLL